MKKSSKKTLEKRGVLVGRAANASGTQVHADKRRRPRPLEKQRLNRELQHETARNRGPFLCLSYFQTSLLRLNGLLHCAGNDRGPFIIGMKPIGKQWLLVKQWRMQVDKG